jgi:hypothetical protein
MTARTMSSGTFQNFCGSARRKRAGSIVVKVRPALLTRPGVVDEKVQAGEALQRCGENSVAFGRNAQICDEGRTRPANSRRRLPLRVSAANSSSLLSTLPKVVDQGTPTFTR